jgi:hypothetical protein
MNETPAERLLKLVNKDRTPEEIAEANFEEGYRQGRIQAEHDAWELVAAIELLLEGYKSKTK